MDAQDRAVVPHDPVVPPFDEHALLVERLNRRGCGAQAEVAGGRQAEVLVDVEVGQVGDRRLEDDTARDLLSRSGDVGSDTGQQPGDVAR